MFGVLRAVTGKDKGGLGPGMTDARCSGRGKKEEKGKRRGRAVGGGEKGKRRGGDKGEGRG